MRAARAPAASVIRVAESPARRGRKTKSPSRSAPAVPKRLLVCIEEADPRRLRGMGLAHLSKNENAIKELTNKGMGVELKED